jgi:hypothetical protein
LPRFALIATGAFKGKICFWQSFKPLWQPRQR